MARFLNLHSLSSSPTTPKSSPSMYTFLVRPDTIICKTSDNLMFLILKDNFFLKCQYASFFFCTAWRHWRWCSVLILNPQPTFFSSSPHIIIFILYDLFPGVTYMVSLKKVRKTIIKSPNLLNLGTCTQLIFENLKGFIILDFGRQSVR